MLGALEGHWFLEHSGSIHLKCMQLGFPPWSRASSEVRMETNDGPCFQKQHDSARAPSANGEWEWVNCPSLPSFDKTIRSGFTVVPQRNTSGVKFRHPQLPTLSLLLPGSSFLIPPPKPPELKLLSHSLTGGTQSPIESYTESQPRSHCPVAAEPGGPSRLGSSLCHLRWNPKSPGTQAAPRTVTVS